MQKPLHVERLPSGCFTVHRCGGVVGTTLPSTFSQEIIAEIGRVVLDTFSRAAGTNIPFTDLYTHFSGLKIAARKWGGGALVFLNPATLNFARRHTPPDMHHKNLEEFVLHLENYIECWKQFNFYVNLARAKKFSSEDESQFLEVKSVIAQG